MGKLICIGTPGSYDRDLCVNWKAHRGGGRKECVALYFFYVDIAHGYTQRRKKKYIYDRHQQQQQLARGRKWAWGGKNQLPSLLLPQLPAAAAVLLQGEQLSGNKEGKELSGGRGVFPRGKRGSRIVRGRAYWEGRGGKKEAGLILTDKGA